MPYRGAATICPVHDLPGAHVAYTHGAAGVVVGSTRCHAVFSPRLHLVRRLQQAHVSLGLERLHMLDEWLTLESFLVRRDAVRERRGHEHISHVTCVLPAVLLPAACRSPLWLVCIMVIAFSRGNPKAHSATPWYCGILIDVRSCQIPSACSNR